MQCASPQNQLFTLQSDREAAAAGRTEEADMAAAEVDAAQRRLAGLEAEKSSLLSQASHIRPLNLQLFNDLLVTNPDAANADSV